MTVFFALSGFLITGLLLAELHTTGNIDVAGFYRRRVRRLVPALVLMLVFAGAAFVVRGEAAQLPLLLAPTAYVANWLVATGGDLEFLKHTWSLAIEEQFYLVWPVALILLLRFQPRIRVVALVLAVAAAIMAARLIVWSPEAFDRLYYGTDTRADALLMGAAAAILMSIGHSLRLPLIAIPAAVGGLVLLSAANVSDGISLGVALPISIALTGIVLMRPHAGGLLTWRPLRYVGRISYGLYLWHYPLLWLIPHPNPAWTFAIIILTFVVAAASFHLVERRWLSPSSRSDRRAKGGGSGPYESAVPGLGMPTPPLAPAAMSDTTEGT